MTARAYTDIINKYYTNIEEAIKTFFGYVKMASSKNPEKNSNYVTLQKYANERNIELIPFSAKIEADLQDLDEDALVKILTEPKNAIVKQYAAMLELDGVKLTITDDGLREIAKMAVARKTGARGLRSILEKILLQPMFDAPDNDELAEIVIDKNVVSGKKPPVEILRDAKKVA